jgi:hypothetical protein
MLGSKTPASLPVIQQISATNGIVPRRGAGSVGEGRLRADQSSNTEPYDDFK